MKTCRLCGTDFILTRNKPGLITDCPDCAKEVPLLIAEQGRGDDGTVESVSTNETVRRYMSNRNGWKAGHNGLRVDNKVAGKDNDSERYYLKPKRGPNHALAQATGTA